MNIHFRFVPAVSITFLLAFLFSNLLALSQANAEAGSQSDTTHKSDNSPPSASQAPAEKGSSAWSGDIDMNQFESLKKAGQAPAKSKFKGGFSCQDMTGHVFKKNDPGFNKCLEDSQSPLMNKPKPVEAPSGERTY